MKRDEFNQAFRSWTRGVSFTLAMGKTQVGVLCLLHYSIGAEYLKGRGHRANTHFVIGARGLQDRGLIRHVEWQKGITKDMSGMPRIADVFPLTEAGKHVLELLKISGIYQEMCREFDEAEKRYLRLRVVA